ncbi:hypothetical protein ABC733_03460 [Mangrovibacter sp. SLW1]
MYFLGGIVFFIVLWGVVGYIINVLFHREEQYEEEDDNCPYE